MTVMTKEQIEALQARRADGAVFTIGFDNGDADQSCLTIGRQMSKDGVLVITSALFGSDAEAVYDFISALHQQLADAKAAQALVLERAAAYHDIEIAALEEQIKENSEYLRRRHGEAGAYAHASEANDYCRTQITIHRTSAAAVRDLADPTGVEELAALRARAEKAEQGRERAIELAEKAQDREQITFQRWQAAEAERDDALTRLAAAEAQVGALREALAWYGEQSRLACLIHSEGDAGRHALQADGGKRARAALASAQGVKHD